MESVRLNNISLGGLSFACALVAAIDSLADAGWGAAA
jgi:hypothetical protein